MGCLHSKKETLDLHPNVYRVVNIDENGADLCSGQLEITETDLLLYREGRDSTVWPLHSLRRYGFEGEIFSFESGRRCETGEGIYAFRCRRATLLFHTLQNQIQRRNIHDSVPYPVSQTTSSHGRQTLQANVIHRSSIDNGIPENLRPANNNTSTVTSTSGPQRHVNQTPRSPSSTDILEVTPLYPRPQATTNHVTNFYQVSDFKREHNNNQEGAASDVPHNYSNDLMRDLAILRNTLRRETALNTIRDIEDETRFLENRYINESAINNTVKDPLSPTVSSCSEHYAQLSLEQESARLYMNIAPNDTKIGEGNNIATPVTPPSPKQVEYCNLSVGVKPDANNMYANLSLGDLGDSVKSAKQFHNFNSSDHYQRHVENDIFTPVSPTEELEVNYAVLDIDSNQEAINAMKESSIPQPQPPAVNITKNDLSNVYPTQPSSRLVSQCSVDKISVPVTSAPSANIGYTTIDFDKTVALTSVAAGADDDINCPRKTRHNSCNLIYGSPSSDKSKPTA